jgi:hypothetical protein
MLEISAALASVKATLDLTRVALDARDDAKAKAAIGDMSNRLSEAFVSGLAIAEKNLALMAQVADMDQQLRELQGRMAERDKYVLHEVAPGRFVYRFEPPVKASDSRAVPTHHLCQPCFDQGKKIVLQLATAGEWEPPALLCPAVVSHGIQLDR